MAGKAKVEVRRFQHLDNIAAQRQAFDVDRRKREIAAREQSAAALPLNASGYQDPGRVSMQKQMAEDIAARREALKAVMALDGDERVLTFCQTEIANADMPEWAEVLNPDGSPLRRGGYVQPLAPGMC